MANSQKGVERSFLRLWVCVFSFLMLLYSFMEKGVEANNLVTNNQGYYYFKSDGTRVEYQPKLSVGLLGALSDDSAGNSNGVKMSPLEKDILARGATVFSNGKGQGSLEVLPKVLVSLPSSNGLSTLLKTFNLELDRKLRLSGHVYSLRMKQNVYDEVQVFSLVRDIMASGMVAWAEPQINEKPIKTQVNDTYFNKQWHLKNKAKRGALCDADCDAEQAWAVSATGAGVVIAVIDDGVQLDHPDLVGNLWTNTAEALGSPGFDDDGNGYVDDFHGYDFVNDLTSCAGDISYSGDGQPGQDGDPSPQASTDCEDLAEDDHGTAVAGIAAAVGQNGLGVAGVAYNASILPIRLLSDYDQDTNNTFCMKAAEAVEYAGRYADVLNNSWSMVGVCQPLEDAIQKVVDGTLKDNNNNDISKRPNLGSPVVFASGNNASGWYKVEVPNITAGEHTFEWRFANDPNADFNDGFVSVWIDDITWPNNQLEDFESSNSLPSDFVTGCLENTCLAGCNFGNHQCTSSWTINTDKKYTRLGSNRSAMAGAMSNAPASCDYLYMGVKKEVTAGTISFWVWFPELEGRAIDGVEVAYPANLATTIAVGASTDGVYRDSSNTSSPNKSKEERSYYSQYGASLDIVAPSGNQHQGVVTTDRTGDDGYHGSQFDEGSISDTDYTSYFGGTSAAVPLVSGAIAVILDAAGPSNTRSAEDIRGYLRQGADKIGHYMYDGLGRTDEVGYGRLNVYQSVLRESGSSGLAATETCLNPGAFSRYSRYVQILDIDKPFGSCPTLSRALTPTLPFDDEVCFSFKAASGNVASICL